MNIFNDKRFFLYKLPDTQKKKKISYIIHWARLRLFMSRECRALFFLGDLLASLMLLVVTGCGPPFFYKSSIFYGTCYQKRTDASCFRTMFLILRFTFLFSLNPSLINLLFYLIQKVRTYFTFWIL